MGDRMMASAEIVTKVCNALREPATYVQLRARTKLPEEELRSALRSLIWTKRVSQVALDSKRHPIWQVTQ